MPKCPQLVEMIWEQRSKSWHQNVTVEFVDSDSSQRIQLRDQTARKSSKDFTGLKQKEHLRQESGLSKPEAVGREL